MNWDEDFGEQPNPWMAHGMKVVWTRLPEGFHGRTWELTVEDVKFLIACGIEVWY